MTWTLLPGVGSKDCQPVVKYTYIKLLHRDTGQYMMVEVEETAVVIDQDGTPNMVLIDRESPVVRRYDADAQRSQNYTKQNIEPDPNMLFQWMDAATRWPIDHLQMYTVKQIDHHSKRNTKCIPFPMVEVYCSRKYRRLGPILSRALHGLVQQ